MRLIVPILQRELTFRQRMGQMRPLGIPSFEDKLVQEVVRMVLEANMRDTLSGHRTVSDPTEAATQH